LGADGEEPVRAPVDDEGHVAQGLHVVDDRRHAVQARDRREGRLVAGLAAAAFQGAQEPGFLAADVGARAPVDDDLLGEVGAQDAVAHVTLGPGLLDGVQQHPVALAELAADVDEGTGRPHRVSRKQNALDEQVRVVLNQHTVVEGARLALIGVAAQIPRPAVVGEEPPLETRREARAAAAPQVRLLDLRVHFGRRHALEGLPQGLIAPLGLVVFDAGQVHLADALGQDLFVLHALSPASHTAPGWIRPMRSDSSTRSAPSRSACRIWSARSGVTLWKYSSLIWIAGAPSQAAMHSPVTSSVNSPSGVVSPSLMPSRSSKWRMSASAPDRPHMMLPQTVMT